MAHLGKLSPIQVMPSVEFEDEDIIDLVTIPNLAIDAKKEHQEEHEKVSGIYLDLH
jgi:hypothetical protein